MSSGLIPGGKSKRDRHAVYFTTVNPMSVNQHEEVEYDLNKPRIAVYKNTWEIHQNTVYWCNLKVAQKKGLQFYHTRSNAITLGNTLPAICIESGKHEVRRRIVQQDVSVSKITAKSRTHADFASWTSGSFQTRSENIHRPPKQTKRAVRKNPWRWQTEEVGETRSVFFDFRIQGLPQSTVQKEDDVRRETVRRPVHQFETHPNRELLIPDLDKNPKFNLFSEESKELIRSMETRSTSRCAKSLLK